jgi:hypothetical protein
MQLFASAENDGVSSLGAGTETSGKSTTLFFFFKVPPVIVVVIVVLVVIVVASRDIRNQISIAQ